MQYAKDMNNIRFYLDYLSSRNNFVLGLGMKEGLPYTFPQYQILTLIASLGRLFKNTSLKWEKPVYTC